MPAVVHAKTTTTHVNPFDAQNNDTIKPIEAKTIDLPIVVEPIEAKTSYKHCIDNIGACISLVYAKNWQNSRFSHAIVSFYTIFYTQMSCYIIFHCC